MITDEVRGQSPRPQSRRANFAPRLGVKTTINLPEDALAALREIAASRNTTLTEVIRRALSVERYLDRTIRAGGKILVEEPDKTVRQLVLL
jgi:hypothetical protein